MKKILVTGADGLLGSNLVRELLNRGYAVKAFLESGRNIDTLDGLCIEKCHGDLLDKNSIRPAFDECDYVVHAAASTRIWPTRNKIVREVNILGTRNISECAMEANVKRMVYVGSANSFGFGTKENPGKEENSFAAHKYKLDYLDSKYEAHKVVLEHVARGLNAVIVNPTFMIGPFDSGPSSGALILAFCNKKVVGFAGGGRNYIYVKDVATAIANALTMGRVGHGYILGNANLTYEEVFALIGKAIGAPPMKRKIPDWLVLLTGRLSNLKATLTGRPPILSYAMAKIAIDDHYFTPQKAIEELKLPQTPLEVAFRDAFDWFKANKYL